MYFVFVDQAPDFKSCPAHQYKHTKPENSTALVVWKDPEAVDNSGFEPVVTCYPPQGNFSIGYTKVFCEAVDQSGNTATCSFNVIVKGKNHTIFI